MSAGTIVIKKNVLTLKKSQARNEDKQQILVIGINVYTVGQETLGALQKGFSRGTLHEINNIAQLLSFLHSL